jgi:hypothetical protein
VRVLASEADPGSAATGAGKPALSSSGTAGPIVESAKVDSEPEVTAVDPETLVVELAPSDEVAAVTGVVRRIGLEVPAVWVVSEAGTSVFAAAAGLATGSFLASSSANKRPGTALTQNDTSKSTHTPLISGPNARMHLSPVPQRIVIAKVASYPDAADMFVASRW